MPRDFVAPGFSLEPRADGRLAIRVRSANQLAIPIRRLAWFVVVVGMTGLAALSVLRVPFLVDGLYVGFFALVAFVLWTDTRTAGIQLDGELLLDVPGHRIERHAGLANLPWTALSLPSTAVIVIAPAPGVDTRRLIGGLGRPCRVTVVPYLSGNEDGLWERADTAEDVPGAVRVLEEAEYEAARGLSEALGRAFGWTVFDLAGDEPERRPASLLDVPLAQRVDELVASIPATEIGRRPWGVTAWRDAVGLHLALRSAGLFGLVTEIAVAIPLLSLLFLLSGGNWGIPLLGVALLVFAFGGRTFVELTPNRAGLRSVSAWLPLGQERLLAWEEIEQVQVVAERGMCGLRFVGDHGTTFVPAPSRAAARWAAVQIRRYLLELARGHVVEGGDDRRDTG